MRCSSLRTDNLYIDDWLIESGQCWAILGRNGSGKKALGQLLAGIDSTFMGDYIPPEGITRILSFEAQQAVYELEIKHDLSDYMDRLDPGTTVREMLETDELPASLGFLKLAPLMDRGYRLLSSGESRKVLLAKALLSDPDFLILDEPYDSLDVASKKDLNDLFTELVASGKPALLFLLNTFEEVSPFMTHMGILEKGQLIAQGEQKTMMADREIRELLAFDASALPPWPEDLPRSELPTPLVSLRNGHVSYGETVIFKDIDLDVSAGDHTLLTGPNGSGKSTLLNLLSGDHPQCYGNDLQVLGFKRGSGETVWEIKKNIGLVSPGLHRDHRVPGSALHIVLSGFFDTIGLYDRPSEVQIRHARIWLQLVGLQERTDIAFKFLSYGEQRLALIARALVKQPPLLLLDEPTSGLDEVNRHRLLYFLEHLAGQQRSTIIMATHRQDEHLALFSKHIKLD